MLLDNFTYNSVKLRYQDKEISDSEFISTKNKRNINTKK